ncbi:MAG TPA: crosslink repair DNA glycosylase YcaQ family protein [Acidimicrobiales bacterium]|nr:crosslink repair DNA glycosylase YcaQ family protein [Acidimicrobiales bacterium]
MRASGDLSNREARWLAIEAQGLAGPRPAPTAGAGHLRRMVDAVAVLQLDAVNVLERTQFLVPFSRIGGYDRGRLLRMAGPMGELFEYWGHAASLLPASDHPLMRWRMEEFRTHTYGGPKRRAAYRAWTDAHSDYIAAVMAEVADRGPLAASELADPRRRQGEWWGRRSLGRVALEHLFARGDLAAYRSASFERVYDLPERVLPADVLAAPTPTPEDAHRALILRAARALGVATAADLADYHRVPVASARLRAAELVEAGQLLKVRVEGWAGPAYVPAGARPRRPRRAHATALSPFDSLIWYRQRASRLFGFDYRIEIYVPGPDRRHGYYVLPLLLGDELVARLDLKADRARSALLVAGAHLEPGADVSTVAPAAGAEARAIASWLGLEAVTVRAKGDLARPLAAAVGAVGADPVPRCTRVGRSLTAGTPAES